MIVQTIGIFSFWSSSDVTGLISTTANWCVAIFGVLAVVFGTRASHLNKAESDEQKQTIEQLEQATRVKPINERLVDFLSELDPKIIPALKNGSTKFHGALPQRKVHELENLYDDADAGTYISLTINPNNNVIIDGKDNPVEIVFVINPDILKRP